MAPWDGGFVWARSNNGNEYIAVACEGTGASLWWPNKDHLSDEPDSMDLHFTIPQNLDCISNGNMISEKNIGSGRKRVDWKVSYPINNYNVTFYIGQYEHFQDKYISFDRDTLAMDYYVFPENLEKAKKHFAQTNKVLEAYEYYFGKYPFWEDGFAMVECSYLGMEHQSAIAYGNQYLRGYMGGMIPSDMNWDYIIVHETGHEYFGNSISCEDHAEMWIHESFTTYMEALYVEYTMSYSDAERYLQSQKFHGNKEAIIGPIGVNHNDWEHSDHYFKGSWILHTLRNSIADDYLWFKLLRGFYDKYQMSNIKSEAFFTYVNEATGRDYNKFFEQYLFNPDIPTLSYRLKQMNSDLLVSYKWDNCVDGFDMPISIFSLEERIDIQPVSNNYNDVILKNTTSDDFEFDLKKYLIRVERIK
jgi:aminopeptidase N